MPLVVMESLIEIFGLNSLYRSTARTIRVQIRATIQEALKPKSVNSFIISKKSQPAKLKVFKKICQLAESEGARKIILPMINKIIVLNQENIFQNILFEFIFNFLISLSQSGLKMICRITKNPKYNPHTM